ncbi:MAG: globin domain-containing protein, partial [Bacteroidota bacterium]
DSLRGLGKKHIKYGVLPSHYPMVGNSLLRTLKEYLGLNWTTEVERAWTEAYEAIASIMLDDNLSNK